MAVPVSGFSCRWDFSNTDSLTLNGSEITAIADLTANNYDLSKGSGTCASRVQSSGLGVSTLYHSQFPGTDNDLLTTASTGLGVTGSATVFIACRKRSADMNGGSSDILLGYRGFTIYRSGSGFMLWAGSSNLTIAADPGTAITTGAVHTHQVSGSSHYYWIGSTNYINGTSSGSGANAVPTVGGEAATGSDWDIGEILIYPSALSQSDRETVRDWLHDKWLVNGYEDAPATTVNATAVAAVAAVDGSGWATRDSLIVMGGESKTGTWPT